MLRSLFFVVLRRGFPEGFPFGSSYKVADLERRGTTCHPGTWLLTRSDLIPDSHGGKLQIKSLVPSKACRTRPCTNLHFPCGSVRCCVFHWHGGSISHLLHNSTQSGSCFLASVANFRLFKTPEAVLLPATCMHCFLFFFMSFLPILPTLDVFPSSGTLHNSCGHRQQ